MSQEYHVKLRNHVISKSLKRQQSLGESSTLLTEDTLGPEIPTLAEDYIEVVPAIGSPLQKVVQEYNQKVARDVSPNLERKQEMLR